MHGFQVWFEGPGSHSLLLNREELGEGDVGWEGVGWVLQLII